MNTKQNLLNMQKNIEIMSYNEKKSIFIVGILHETNTYSNKKTFIKHFK